MALLKLKPSFKDYIWGGRRLVEEYNKEYDGEILAESWELSCHPDGPSYITNGPDAGLTLQQYIDKYGKEVLGRNCRRFQEFPILIKFIDAKDNLSIQVHPDNRYALEHEGQYGKTEVWYVMDCKEGAFLYYGFAKEVDKEEFARRIKDNTLTEVLNAVPVKKGDVLFIEAGTIHAIGKDIVIAEIQQNSNVTYRVYDYGRVGKDGKPRDLHVEKALDVTNRTPMPKGQNCSPHIADCDYFTVDKLNLDGKTVQRVEGSVDGSSFASLLILEGEGRIRNGNTELSFCKGDSLFLTADSGEFEVSGACQALMTTIGKKENMIRLGIDIGGTAVKMGLVNDKNELIAQTSIPTKSERTAQEVIEDIGKAGLRLLSDNDLTIDACAGVGVGCPGTVDSKNGVVVYSNNLGWKEVELAKELKKYLPLPTEIRNDATVAALGEAVAGAAKGAKDVVMITLGTGLGGGIIIDGKVYEGGLAGGGELGHTVIAAGGEPCTCGRKGCLEAYASATALIRDARKALESHPGSLMMEMCGQDPANMNGKIPFDAAKLGDETALAVVDQYIEYLGIGVANFINIFRPEQFIIGGGISKQGTYLTDALKKVVGSKCFGGETSALPEIKTALLDNSAGMIGAANLI